MAIFFSLSGGVRLPPVKEFKVSGRIQTYSSEGFNRYITDQEYIRFILNSFIYYAINLYIW
jgi:hypothetical protein